MKKKSNLLSMVLALSLFLPASMLLTDSVKADGIDGGRIETDRPITAMDENGNIYELEDESGIVPDVPMADAYDETEAQENPDARVAGLGGQIVNFNTKGNSNTEYKDSLTGEPGYTNAMYGADAAYLGKDGSYVKFMLAGVTGKVAASEVQIVNASSANSVSHYAVSNGRLYHYITTKVTNSGYDSTLDNGPAPSYLSAGTNYYSYDGHYFYTANNFANMLSDYQAGNRSHSVNSNSPYYNYFQYLPLRSTTNYSASELSSLINAQLPTSNSKMRDIGGIMTDKQNTYGVNALLMSGVAANESAWGSSNYAIKRNNLFGLNAVDSNPDNASYHASPDSCVKEFAEVWMSKGYLSRKDWRCFGGFLGNKASGINVKYASDPYWGEKAATMAWILDRNGGNRDSNKYTLGIKTSTSDVNLRAGSSTSSAKLYSTGSQVYSSYLILNQNKENGFWRIQSDSVLNKGRTGIDTSTGNYNFDTMYAYVHSDYVSPVISGSSTGSQTPPPASSEPSVSYRTHVQTYGWQGYVADGAMSGTSGQAKRLEGIQIKLDNAGVSGSVQYSTHVQTYGWQDFVADDAVSGTVGKAKRLEAIKIQLTGQMAEKYDIYYRVHAQTFGWLGWAKNGSPAGTSGYAKRLEGIEIRLVSKGGSAPGSVDNCYKENVPSATPPASVNYRTHVQTHGWQDFVADGAMSGTSGQAKRLEGIEIKLSNPPYDGSIQYRTHVQTYGWQDFVADGTMSGTSGQAKRLEAIEIRLTGQMADKYDVYYRVHAQTFGWLGWAKNGAPAGTSGYAKRLEGIEIKLLPKGSAAPGSTQNCHYAK